MNKAQLREKVLTEKHLELQREPWRRKVVPIYIDPRKTALMLRLEALHGEPIQQLISKNVGTLAEVSSKLSVSISVVCRWRKKLGINRAYEG